MKKPKNNALDGEVLRLRAEELLSRAHPQVNNEETEYEVRKLLHELQVYQIELELQNEEIIAAKSEVEELAEKYQELYDFSPSGFITLSEQGDILELNYSAARMLYEERSDLIGKKFENFILDDTREQFNNCLQNIFKFKTTQTSEFVLTKNSELPIYVNANCVLDQQLALCHLILVDITENKMAEKKLFEAKIKAEESERLKSAFLANMSHEIRTPLNGILGFAGFLRDPDISTEEFKQYNDIIEQSGYRLLNIINDIIDISKIEAGSSKLTLSDTSVNEQIEYLYAFFQPEADAKNIQLFLKKTLTAKEAFIKTDREKLFAILSNLIKNAIKYTRNGTISVGYLKKGANLEFYVKDTGIGIAKSQQESIFERFMQVENTVLQVEEGTGLGLAISKAFVEMLGGKLWVESELGQGATFFFTVPYITRDQGERSSSDFRLIENESNHIKRLKVLVADDEPASNFLLSILLRKQNHYVMEVTNGQDAVEACFENPDIDLVLMDIRMPILNGYEATKKIRDFNNQVVIIAQTAFGFPGDREKAIEAGCNDYITKPIDKKVLFELLRTYFQV